MNKPMLQIALDNLTITSAIEDAKKAEKYLDVIEVGTILISSEGKIAIKKIREAFPNKIIVADGKIADAGAVFGKMFFENGANYTTVICAAETSTLKQTIETAKKFPDTDVQVEMTTHFTWEQVAEWKKAGLNQVVWHRSRDSQKEGVKWDQKNIDNVKRLADMGFNVTVTGGIDVEDIKLFKGIPIYIFIAGRTIRDAKNPELAAKELQDEIAKYWK
ncbi:3-keto-L-gulonate-6-phosphate decarboxylase UlaD [[Mycoplasma] testudinis]|uniref:3-keto-L-gulonate-6-phosphate decarboxylase UlaD n=1 Tax=[Mycoplasma] testudinis TaxID=33924 RepID=UPI0004841AFF|nr:3-keto-L-gulonate-6-phosphate decarboxylase UlaD [[Mycoplasma] testudinis]